MEKGAVFKVAIDGPSGVGKSTVALRVAEKLDALYIDTGAMYRAVAVGADMAGIGLGDEEVLNDFLSTMELGFNGDRIALNGVDFTEKIREPRASELASIYSSISIVRARLVEIQKELAASADRVVMEGRDIGTVVLIDADIKFFLTASVEVRTQRRVHDEKSLCKETKEDVDSAMRLRDLRDKTRKDSPLKKAPDAVEVDTAGLNIEGVVDIMLNLIEERF
ncbi:MAG: (d)CMP kinase [Thermodesulfobacteriota bacterium]